MKTSSLSLLLLGSCASFVFFNATADAQEKKPAPAVPQPILSKDANFDENRRREHILITGGKRRIDRIPGSAHVIGKKELEKNNYTDIHRIVREVPGLNVQEEDGNGLRPNIGMRGGRVDRSSDITLMEDGILIAPAPYSASAAYYFPRMERMQGVEIRKGSSSIMYGPYTTNGALNLLSSDIPSVFSGKAVVAGGSHETGRAGINIGDSYENFGYVLDAYHNQSDGFKNIDVVGGSTGYDIQDVMGKFRVNTSRGADVYQELELKLGATDEESDETYLGLTDADFASDPYRRYAASQLDNMDARHYQRQLTHYIEPAKDVSVSTTFYRNDFARNWYKLQSVRAGGVSRSLNDVLTNPTANAAQLAVLQGGNSAAGDLSIRANDRTYYSQGIETKTNVRSELFGVKNEFDFGIRYHYDEEDRFQQDDGYQMTNGIMALTNPGAPGSNANRIGSANAWALFLQDEISLSERLTVTPGVRFEHIKLTTENYGNADPNRLGTALSVIESTVSKLIPGIGADYWLTDQWKLFAGVHKGFAPPPPPANLAATSTDPEESVNYEAGVRYRGGFLTGDLVGFYTDYENLLGRDTFSSGGGGTSDVFNGGEVDVVGLEASVGYDLSDLTGNSNYRLPVKAGYTYTKAEFKNSFASSFEEWGNVTSGDELPYIPKHQVFVSAGVETDTWSVGATAKFNGKMRTEAGSGSYIDSESTDENFVIDTSADYEIYKGTKLFVNVNNVLDDTYIAARRPAGLRPGAPRTFLAGIKYSF